jgi:nitronate monooxygenase
VRTDPKVSSTGFPFKVVELEGTLSDPNVYLRRERLCDIGILRQLYKRKDGKIGYRCPGEPAERYLAKGGKPEELEGRGCLCNNLAATAGFPQTRKDGYVEPPLVTAGNGIHAVRNLANEDRPGYSAQDVLNWLAAV